MTATPENTRAIRTHVIIARPGDDDWGTPPDYVLQYLTDAQYRHLAENPSAFPLWPEGETPGLTEAERNEMNSVRAPVHRAVGAAHPLGARQRLF